MEENRGGGRDGRIYGGSFKAKDKLVDVGDLRGGWPTSKCSSSLLGEEYSKGNLTNALKNGQHLIIKSSFKITLHGTSIYRVQERKKLVREAS